MTVSTVVDHNDYTGNGVTTSFPYTFRIFKKTDLAVSVVDLSENITVLVLDTDYTVTNAGGYSGGNVVLTAPLGNGWKISIARELEPTQETDLRNQGKFFAEVHEDAFDKLTMLIQQAYSVFRLALRKPSSIANWYDALNNYIRNLRDPSQPQDAATKNYVDVQVSQSNQTNQNLFKRTLRVPEDSIPQLQPASVRSNKILAFDSAGNPIFIVPQSGSASDVLIELAKLDSTVSIAGITAASVANNIRSTGVPVEEFGIKVGEVADLTKLMAAFNSAEHLLFRGTGIYILPDFNMPSSAKCRKITVKLGSVVKQGGYNAIFNVVDYFELDLSDGGIWHGGLKKALVTADTAIGSNQIPVDDASVFKVGDMITTSFLIPDDVTNWKWSNSSAYGQINYITAINGNVLTVQNPVETRTLMKNVWVGNWRFGMAGLEFRGAGKARIIGGKMQEFKTYGLTCRNVDVTVEGTEITGMTIDCIYVIGTANFTMRNFRFEGCYDFGKLGIQHTSTGRVTLQNGYWRRGNFDADINHANQTSVSKFGKIVLNNVTCVATSTLKISGDQIDSVTGQTANQLFGNRINPARIFCSASYATTDFNSEGFEAVNSSFLDYQRITYGVEGAYGGNIAIDSLVLRDVVTTGALFNFQVASGKTVIVRAHELRDLSVTRKYTVHYYPLFYVSANGVFFSFSGLLKYDNGGYVGVDHSLEMQNAYIPEMEIVGSGSSTFMSPTFVGELLVRQGSVSKVGTGQRNDFTSLVLLQGASIVGDLKTFPSRLMQIASIDLEFNANDNTTWKTIFTKNDGLNSLDFRIQLVPNKKRNADTGLCGVISGKLLKDGTSVSVVTSTSTYLSGAAGNLAYWEGKVVGTQGAIADGSVHVRCLSSGEFQINVNTTSYYSGTVIFSNDKM